MTIKQLIKALQKIDKESDGKRPKVYLNCQDAMDKYNGCFSVIEISEIKTEYIEMGDGDGWGTGRHSHVLTLS
jgi:hypothetical protein|tara:strand:+ start:814 stop:1032 length:219 start_codon:yes stop_codon:yes gene_type:complete